MTSSNSSSLPGNSSQGNLPSSNPSSSASALPGPEAAAMTGLHPAQLPIQPPWPLQMGQPLREAKYSQQQSKCNKRQLGTEAPPQPDAQMH